jgi:hypothetical protein
VTAALLPACYVTVVLASLAVSAVRLGQAWAPSDTPAMRWLTALAVATVQIVAVAEITVMVGLFDPIAIGIGSCALTMLAIACTRHRANATSTAWFPSLPVWARALCGSGAGLLIGLSLNGASTEFDTRHYHVVDAVQWVNTGSFWTLPFAQPGDHTATTPGVSDLLSAVFMLASHSVVLATLPSVMFTAFAVAAGAVLAERLGASPWRGVVALLLLIGVSGYFDTQIHSMMSDAAVVAPLLAALALLLGDGRPRRSTLLVAGALAGVAGAAKYNGLLDALVGIAVVVVWQRRALSSLVIAALPALAIAAPWYIRNGIIAGNPIYPEAITLGPLRLRGSAGPFTATPGSLLKDVLAGHGGVLLTTADAFSTVLGPLLIVVVLALVPGGEAPPRARRAVMALLLGWGCAYAVLPYTGGDFAHIVAGGFRYALPVVMLAVILGAVRLPSPLFGTVVLLGIGWDLWSYHLLPGRPDLAVTLPLAATAFAGALIGCAGAPLLIRLFGWQRAAPSGIGVLAVACGTAGVFATQTPSLPVAGSVAAQLASASSVACIAISDMQAVLGPRLETRIVAVGRDGPLGAQQEITVPQDFSSALASLRPTLVAVGNDSSTVPPPPWSPPSDWTVIGQVEGATIYRPRWLVLPSG